MERTLSAARPICWNMCRCLTMVRGLPRTPARGEPGEHQDPLLLFAEKVLIHSIWMWQSFESPTIDLLTPLGLSPLTSDPDDIPTFVYWIKWYFDDLNPYVDFEDVTWGRLKGLYRGEEAE